METIRILIIEDDEDQQALYSSCIREYNKEHPDYEIIPTQLNSINDYFKSMFDNSYDALIADITLGNDCSGNIAIEKTMNSCRLPVFVVSGDFNKLSVQNQESFLFRKYNRDGDFYTILDEIVGIYNTGYSRALALGGKLEELISKVYWDYLNDKQLPFTYCDPKTKENRVLRYTLSRISDILKINDQEKHDAYNASECVIIPPIGNEMYPGDVIEYNGEDYIVISADCDVENGKSDYITLCGLNPEYYTNFTKRCVPGYSNNVKSEIQKHVNNNVARYHLIPATSRFKGNVIDFQQVVSIKKEEILSATKKATVSSEFMKDIRFRFSSYYGRQGQPQLISDEIIEQICKYNENNSAENMEMQPV